MDPQEKAIFRYHNGTRMVWADPLTVQRRLDAALGDPDVVFKDVNDNDPLVWRPALECLIAAVREVFVMPGIDPETGQGATEEDCRTALNSLQDFLAKKKPSAAGSPILSAPTESCPSPSTTPPSSA